MENDTKAQKLKSLLKVAIDQTEDVKGQFKAGLGAIKGNEKQKFVVPDTRKITGSLDIDSSTKNKYPQDNRWDYAVEYNQETFFIEIHPGSTNEISTVLAKLNWLKIWLRKKAPAINALKPKDKQPYHWVYTNKFAILPNSKYARQLAQAHLRPVKQWEYCALG
ncbi:MAG: hypothetical protein J6M53_02915 [Bacteroidaceae bacterium]|nr:hypothetical protein [Bacteroidaceae bacterium]